MSKKKIAKKKKVVSKAAPVKRTRLPKVPVSEIPTESGSFASRLQTAMVKGKWNQRSLSAAVGCSPSAIHNWLYTPSKPSVDLLFPLTDALKCPPRWLVTGEKKAPKPVKP